MICVVENVAEGTLEAFLSSENCFLLKLEREYDVNKFLCIFWGQNWFLFPKKIQSFNGLIPMFS